MCVIELDPRRLIGGARLFVPERNASQFPIEAVLLRLAYFGPALFVALVSAWRVNKVVVMIAVVMSVFICILSWFKKSLNVRRGGMRKQH